MKLLVTNGDFSVGVEMAYKIKLWIYFTPNNI